MAQTLLIGLGGTGSRVVNNVVKELRLNKKDINNGEMCCAVLDTNVNDNEAIAASNTGVPIFGTSKPQKIWEYFDEYAHLHMETWCPQSPEFLLNQSMIDGASELRVKSRIAFMDSLESGVIRDLELLINEVLKNNSGSKIRIMIVSSLSGGTGSGMFIQVALWLRKFLSQSQITIRGIFLLPDIFVHTLKDIRESKAKTTRHYCNAYAAIRELNAITKIMKNNTAIDLPEEISLGNLFDSLRDADTGKPVYDFAFFVDYMDENNVQLYSLAEYEKMVAQLVYMQLYAPMASQMYSEEDNAFLAFTQNPEPLYGSCGTAKAVYPTESVKTYCALRAAQDSLTGGWKRIDDEIDTLIREKEQAEKDGYYSSETIDRRTQFVKLFDEKAAVPAEETGRDRFFLSISRDIKNETKVKVEGDKVAVKYTDKVDDFITLLKMQKIDTLITRYGGTEDFSIDADAFVSADHTKEELLSKARSDASGLEEVLDTFDAKVDEYANGIVNSVFPFSMGEVTAHNRCTIYGLLTKANEMGGWDFIHPVAARYVLYKLVAQLEKTLKGIVLSSSRDDALSGGDIGTLFDNKATSTTETSFEAFLSSKKWYQGESAFLDDFERRYAEFVTTKKALCEKYEKECLQVSVYRKLIDRVNGLISSVEAFFRNLDDARRKLNDELVKNVSETVRTGENEGKVKYVFADPDDKESIYRSLDFELDKSSSRIHKSVIDTLYGRFCAEKRPSNPENAAYLGVDTITAFVRETMSVFREKIDRDSNNSGIVNMDIYTALCRESDAEFAKRGGKSKAAGGIDDLDITTGEVRVDTSDADRHEEAFKECRKDLVRMAAPFLIRRKEVSKNELGVKTTLEKTFWGFNPALREACPQAGAVLGINADLQMHDAYPANELQCYRAVYGMEARYVPKFNEFSSDGDNYYTCYSFVINEMVREANGRSGKRAYVSTPHLDMNWHRLLPYITEEKQRQDNLEFFHGLWLAIAYGVLRTDRDGNICIRRSVDGGYGSYIDDDVPVMYKNKPLTKTDVARLITVLRSDMMFTGSDIPKLERMFREELEELTTYVGTDALKGLLNAQGDLNPVDVITRYNESRRVDKFVSAALVGALEKIAGELAERYDVARTERQLEEAKYRICRKIYDSGKRSKGRSEIFGRWEEAFERFKIKEEGSDGSADDSSI